MEILLNYPLFSDSLEACLDSVLAQINSKHQARPLTQSTPHSLKPLNFGICQYAACLNPHSYCEAQKDPDFQKALLGARWLLPDGSGMVLASRILGGSIRKRLTGSDLFTGICQKINVLGGYRVFLLGSSQETLERICTRMATEYPQIQVAGTYSPPFKAQFSHAEMDAMVNAVNHVAPDILWVAMTAPKQEKWLLEAQKRLNVPFAGAIGAVFDFYSGSVVRPSLFFQNLGLEWLPRLLQEPKRLYRRMAVSAPIFLGAIVVQWWRKLFPKLLP